MIADAYATAMIVMGSNRAIDLANKLNLSIVLIYSEEQDFKEVKINL
jgi:thiamine biosynthesis lipoprotein ApbE